MRLISELCVDGESEVKSKRLLFSGKESILIHNRVRDGRANAAFFKHFRWGTRHCHGVLDSSVAVVFSHFTKKNVNYNLDPKGVQNAFEPFLAKYLKLAETMIGLATGSIVLLVGSSALHGEPGHVPKACASPLFLLAFTILSGIACFIVAYVWLIVRVTY
jgi:hypothetical protein